MDAQNWPLTRCDRRDVAMPTTYWGLSGAERSACEPVARCRLPHPADIVSTRVGDGRERAYCPPQVVERRMSKDRRLPLEQRRSLPATSSGVLRSRQRVCLSSGILPTELAWSLSEPDVFLRCIKLLPEPTLDLGHSLAKVRHADLLHRVPLSCHARLWQRRA